jgi:hypothetical protein
MARSVVLITAAHSSYKQREHIDDMKTDNAKTSPETRFHLRASQRPGNPCFEHAQSSFPSPFASSRTTAARAYWRGLHAAEMAAWEMTGGDYLLPHCARIGVSTGSV